jgi:hypothetical protein
MAFFKFPKIKLNIKLLILTLFLTLFSTALHTFLVETDRLVSEDMTLKGQVLQAVSIPAFPGAEGFGSQTIGGRGGRVIKVTNLNNRGPGSLREAMQASGPRIVVFDVSGTITLDKRIDVVHSYLTVAGQTSPGQGIQIKGRIRLRNDVHNIVLRYLRIRSEDPGCPDPNDVNNCPSQSSDSLEFNGEINNVIVDHCSIAWATDESFSFYNKANNGKDIRNVTISWNIIAEGEKYPSYMQDTSGSNHSMGLLMSGRSFNERIENISIHHNLFIHNDRRNPLIGGGASPSSRAGEGVFRVINNVIYNGRLASGMRPKYGGIVRVDYINNYYRKGPNSGGLSSIHCEGAGAKHRGICEIYHSGNIVQNKLSSSISDVIPRLYSVLEANEVLNEIPNPHLNDGVTIVSAQQALAQVIKEVGVMLPAQTSLERNIDTRDSVDTRLIRELETATGRVGIDSDSVRRYSYIPSVEPPVDSDNDGMPDVWEIERGLNPGVDDSAGDRDGDGSTNIEEYINGLVSRPAGPTSTPTPTPTPAPLPTIPGDLDGDGDVDIFDLILVGSHFGEDVGVPCIDIFDLITVGSHFGEGG